MRSTVVRSLITLALCAGAALPMSASADEAPTPAQPVDLAALAKEQLPNNPDLLIGKLENGLSYVIKKHANPPGRMSLRLNISSGSINETDRQRGLAHFLEHLAFNGSKNYPPGSVVPFFESIGLTFGRHQNASTSLDRTLYMLDLPNNQAETIEKGLAFMSDVLGRLSLLEDEIDKERQIILEEKRSGLGPDQRLLEQWLPALTPGSRIGQRLPIGVEETILGGTRQDFADYYNRWYTTGNSTIVAIGDMDPQEVLALITRSFSDIPAGPRPRDEDASVKPYSEPFAFVGSDKELTRCEVRITRMGTPKGPVTNAASLREEFVTALATTAFNRRMQSKIAAGDLSFRQGGASVGDQFGAVRWANATATGKSEDWKAMMSDLAAEVKRADKFGFTQREVDDARRAQLAQWKQISLMEGSIPAAQYAFFILQPVQDEEPIMSAKQNYEYLERLLPTISTAEVTEAFRREFNLEDAAYVVLKPADGITPTESEVLATAHEVMASEILAETESDRPTSLMGELPRPGKVAEMAMHPASQVHSFWLDNNVRVHYRFMDYRKEQASITVTLPGGRIEETAQTKGLSQAASIPLTKHATSKLSSTNIRDLLTGKSVNVGGFATEDAVLVTASGNPADLEAGMQVIHLLLTDPKIEQAAFDQWKQAQAQSIESRKTQPTGVFSEVLPEAIYPKGDARFFPLDRAELDAITIENAQKWLTTLVSRAPIEVAVVGDIDKDKAMELVTRYLGSLPKRERISDQTLASARALQRPAGPREASRSFATETKQAFVWEGFYGADAKNVRDTRLMDMAARILSSRMIKRVREEEQLVYSIRATSAPAVSYPGFGRFSAGAPTEPAKTARLKVVLREMMDEFAKNGPTEEEVATAKGQVANTLDENMKEPAFWTGQLSDMTYRDAKLDDVMNAPEMHQGFTRDEIHQTFRKYYESSGPISVLVTPEA